MPKRIAIFPGSFDPFTKGHHDIVQRGLKIFDEIVIAIGYNSKKQNRYFDIDLMVNKLEETFQNESKVSIIVYNKLTSNLAKDLGAGFLLRGLRNTTDFEYENSIAQVNKYLNEGLESVFLITAPEYAAISSTIIREVHKFRGNVDEFLPYTIE
ncbi:phosphopantetheine adenylyltransferase [Marivirga tractuosa]|uniref:Phosphopantetheine adenylyltransferase n=1 Tax=Marivirga tractuosa (strain ATCC 23168 / DSM 4126 / NBRC 15989 / NCIMB 1408 / VKM B-1430 / H-43) TaxID=643867 RepID=E4TT48_MARTH|nr:pantetheine-phosphate adenylyltransferase [Marivirga tractuosa]ADR20896.1 Phosphopantetheine adenylyltransferase [Marivirga tractuosa DSM 4126]BDD14653.1 phosphopantetheine adenylyltransferase [Marivirga tractuosa]